MVLLYDVLMYKQKTNVLYLYVLQCNNICTYNSYNVDVDNNFYIIINGNPHYGTDAGVEIINNQDKIRICDLVTNNSLKNHICNIHYSVDMYYVTAEQGLSKQTNIPSG